MPDEALTTSHELFRCSFCFKPQDQVTKLIAGPGVMICSECVALCVPIMAAAPTEQPTSIRTPADTPTAQLTGMLAGYNKAFESIDQAMQDMVEILREREVSWAAIGEALGVSRQAAWKRFG